MRKILLSPDKIDSILPVPRSIDIRNNKLLLGTLGSEIIELEFENDNFLNGTFRQKNILSSHFSSSSNENNQINDITYWKAKDMFISVADDCSMRIFDPCNNKQISYIKLDIDNDGNKIKHEKGNFNKGMSIDLNSRESEIVIGMNDGTFRVKNTII